MIRSKKGLAPLAALTLCLALAPIQSQIWNQAATPAWIQSLEGLHSTAQYFHGVTKGVLGPVPYDAFGRLMPLVYCGALIGLFSVASSRMRLIWIARISLGIAALADVVAYWIAGLNDPDLRFYAFWVTEVPALVVCILALSAFGIQKLRQDTAGQDTAGQNTVGKARNLLLASTPLLALGTTASVQYMPHGPMVGITIAVLALSMQS